MKLSYEIVIATRNRAAALRMSLPLMAAQSVKPDRILVIDASDDHLDTVRAVDESLVDSGIVYSVLRANRMGITPQRNQGLDLVVAPIVFYPDDDALWHPGYAEAKMLAYLDETVSAVCGYEVPNMPGHVQASYRMNRRDRLMQHISRRRNAIENTVFPNPLVLCMEDRVNSAPRSANVIPVHWMTGFRMSFRTEVIRKVRFDETLDKYALFEDVDASFGAWRYGRVVCALDAKVHHYRDPSRRGSGYFIGESQIANRAYIVAKHSTSTRVKRQTVLYSWYKVAHYALGCGSQWGRERFVGAFKAALKVGKTLHGSAEDSREICTAVI